MPVATRVVNIEDAVAGLELLLRNDLPKYLDAITMERNDGIKLEPIRSYEWEEVRDAIKNVPCALIVGNEEVDLMLQDKTMEARIIIFIILTDRAKTYLTKKLYRYAEALRRSLRPAAARTLNGMVISVKLTRVSYSPTFVDRDNLFARDLQAELSVRIPRGDC